MDEESSYLSYALNVFFLVRGCLILWLVLVGCRLVCDLFIYLFFFLGGGDISGSYVFSIPTFSISCFFVQISHYNTNAIV